MNNLFWYLPYSMRYHAYKLLKPSYFKQLQLLRHTIVEGEKASLKGFDDLKCIFVHIPKNGGVSLNKLLFNNLGGGHCTIKRYSLIFNKREFNAYYKFAIVRNPIDRLRSAYYFLKNGGLHEKDKFWFNNNLVKFANFNDFVENWLTDSNIYSFPHFVPQFEYVIIAGKIMVDDVFKLENLEKDFQKIRNRLQINKELIHLNRTMSPQDNLHIYSRKCINKIHEIYRRDFEYFQYYLE